MHITLILSHEDVVGIIKKTVKENYNPADEYTRIYIMNQNGDSLTVRVQIEMEASNDLGLG